MDLHSAKPYSLIKHGIIRSYPSICENMNTDVAILGAGITGALVSWHLMNEGIPCILLEKRHVGMGSTAASTALLQYEIDVTLEELIKLRGRPAAEASYLLCRDAIYKIESICQQLQLKTGFTRKFSFQYASLKSHAPQLLNEFRLRKNIGINLEILGAAEIGKLFGIDKEAGLLSADGASVDAYLLTHALLERSLEIGLQVFDNTKVVEIENKGSRIVLKTDWGPKVSAKKLVIACGYESQKYLPRKVEKFWSTYAIASEISASPLWYQNSLIWETAKPYLYMRTTDDNRIIAGGKDDPFSNPAIRDERMERKSRELTKSFSKLFPGLTFRRDFSWAGTFASTKDGLPYIGKIAEKRNTLFALGFGGNGITFSALAAEIIRDELCGKRNPGSKLFAFDR